MGQYGFIKYLGDECKVSKKYTESRNKNNKIDTKLYRMELRELEFINKAKKGGRVCPRIFKIEEEACE